ncbi:LysR family transcriptional regulator [Enterobacter sp. Acro-832]|uniref:LysR family transcriptional regulator n=1 Tax=Enterobacter sp. Acro-832 TaxID=2608348 RepID=UPI0014233BE8|nr:LysR family transcriptional regulator [Enterobacter sp. Acro-832]NIG46433.1 LysR family transcriptional regulator [Enterobacter sp. Acro-832]
MNIKDIQSFLLSAETGSLTKAAARINTTPMTVSRRLASLENELGRRLLHRTTRAVALTDEGEEFMPYARAMLEAEEDAKRLFANDQKHAAGQLRITAPSGFGRRTILPVVPGLLDSNPELKIELELNDNITDIVGLGFDVAIRIAPLRDSRLVAHKLADNQRVLCASPHYLARYGTPQSLADLYSHSCLRLTGVLQWAFLAEEQIRHIRIDGRFSASNVEEIRSLCKAGAGLAQLTEWDVREELETGDLVKIELGDVTSQMLAVWAVFPTTRHLPSRVNIFLNALKQYMFP